MGDVVRPGSWTTPKGGDNTSGSEPPEGPPLEKRIAKLEETISDVQVRLVRIETRLEQTSTKSDLVALQADLFKAMNDQTWKFIGAATGMSALFSAIAFGLARALN